MPTPKIEAEYFYRDEAGTILHKKTRYIPKTFKQSRPDLDEPGRWIYDLTDVRKVLYRLPDLQGQKAILMVEGEKDVEASWAIGVPATCTPDGAGKWLPEYGEQLKAQGVERVAVIPDNDPPGTAHAILVCVGLCAAGIDTRLVTLPGLPDHGDLSDYLQTHTKADLLARVKATEPYVAVAEIVSTRRFQQMGEQRYVLTTPNGIVLEANRLRRSSQELHGELLVRVNGQFPEARTFGDGILQVGDMNFSSTTTRTSRSKLLAERAGEKSVDWYGILEEFITEVLAAERRGKPAEPLAEAEDEEDDGSEAWLIESFPLLQQLPQIVFGDAASGKSYFAMWLAGKLAGMGIPVLYADWEFSKSEHKKRLQRLFQPMPKNLLYIRCDHPLKQETDHLIDVIQKHRIQYIVCDSIGFAVDGPAESQEGAAGYFRYLRQLKVGSLNIAHIPKQFDDNREATVFGCYSEDTEVLTSRGWKPHAKVGVSDCVLAWSPTGYRWEFPTAVHRYDYRGQMLHLSTSTTDALVTPNHRCAVRTPAYATGSKKRVQAGPWRFIQAQDLPRQIEVPLSADFGEPLADAPVIGGDDWIRLIGWWISEGSLHGKKSFSIAQATDSPLTPRLLATMDRLNIPFTKTISKFAKRPHEKEMCYITSATSALHYRIWFEVNCGSGAASKRLPTLAWALSKRQKQVLLEALIDGDGSRLDYGGTLYHTVSRQLADDVQRLAIECGCAASIRFDSPGKVWHFTRCTVKISREARRTLSIYKARHTSSIDYDGQVYCLTVPSGAYVTRRNGKMAIYGNSVFFKAGARSIWFIDRAKENPNGEIRFGLYHRKNNVGALLQPKGFKLVFRGDVTSVEAINLKDVEELAAGFPLLDRMRELLVSGPLNVKSIAEELSTTVANVRGVLSRHRSQFVKVGSKISVSSGRPEDNSEGVAEF